MYGRRHEVCTRQLPGDRRYMSTETTSTHHPSLDSVMPRAIGATERCQTISCPGVTRRIMVVESDPALRNLLAELLALEGYFVTEAADEQAMLRCTGMAIGVLEEQFDLVILGMQTGGELGFESLARLRESGCHTPAIVLSAQPKSAVAQQISDLNALFLGKPLELDNLRVIVRHVIHARSCGFCGTA